MTSRTALSLNDIRRTFLDGFARAGHTIVPSAPLVPRNDPTLLFVNAGMVPFKNVFTGAETRDYVRATSAQKCVRAGGKHNDLDNVGYTARHHTFFEMMGNFSFGDYFKDVAIELAWGLVTKDFGLDPSRLVVTVFAEDDEAFDLWRKIAGLPEDRIIRIATSDNFWSMGDTGPCGPCSEIFFDHGPEIPGGPPGSPDEDGDRYVEIWNLVVMEYEQVDKDARIDLPRPSIDTGMGLERMATVLQGVHNNYDTDLFQQIITASEEISRTRAAGDRLASHRVIADHLRAASFLIADGVLPSNEGRGYVLRRIMRRAMRHAHLLGTPDPLLWQLVPSLVAQMGAAYPELERARALVTETLKLEETRFRQTLERGLRLLDEETGDLNEGSELQGEVAFKLYDTYGFPLDLTQDALRQRGIGVDTDGFDAAMARQRAEARKAWSGSGEAATETLWFDLQAELGGTDFLGYATEQAEGTVLALVKDGARVETAQAGDGVIVITNQTPFYGESGGQVGDTGTMVCADDARLAVTDTQKKLGTLFIHMAQIEAGTLTVGATVEMVVDGARRARIRANHSATHLLHEALRRRLGDHVTQKGSLVSEERLRFDISQPKPVAEAELADVEAEVNAMIRANGPVTTRIMTPDDAIEAGALALFGEKYGDEVRVLTMGEAEAGARAYSVELCGGTHVSRLGDIGLFKIVGEGAVSAGVRRIEAMTGEAARAYFQTEEDALKAAAGHLKAAPLDVPERVSALIEERKRLERELAAAKKALALGGGAGEGSDAPIEEVDGIALMARTLTGVSAKDLRALVDEAKKKVGSGVVAFVAVDEAKVALSVGVTADLTGRVSAVDLVKLGAEAVGGKGGGGRPDMAQAGGSDPDKAEDAIAAITKGLKTLAAATAP
ncbi:MAG: alanine--tRNA ligase [Alphaproteobacteria bacterium]